MSKIVNMMYRNGNLIYWNMAYQGHTPTPTPTAITGTVIDYTSTDGNIVTCDAPYISNTYDANGGHIQFDTVLTEMPSFIYQTRLETIEIPDSVTKLPYNTFRACENLTAVTIPSSITELTEGPIFKGCTKLVLSIPATVTAITNAACSGT